MIKEVGISFSFASSLPPVAASIGFSPQPLFPPEIEELIRTHFSNGGKPGRRFLRRL